MTTQPTQRVDGGPVLTVPEALAQRRATRHFDPQRPLPDDLLKQILHLATLAPSGNNMQPWRFLVVRSRGNREKLRQCAFGQAKIAEAPVVIIVLGYRYPHRTHLDRIIQQQIDLHAVTPEVAAAIKGSAASFLERVPDRDVWAHRSTMLGAMALLLAAQSLGVASAPMEGFDPEKIRAAFGVPDDHSICCLIALGFPTGDQPFPGRLGLDDVCYEEHFGQPWTLGDV